MDSKVITLFYKKGKSIWDIEENYNDSCRWKKLLDLRNRIRKHVFYSIGNGIEKYLYGLINGIRKGLYVTLFLEENAAKWFNGYPVLSKIAIPALSDGINDKVYWLNNQNEKKEFSTKQVWIDIRENIEKVKWHHVAEGLIADLNGLVFNILESSGCEGTLVPVFPFQLGFGRKLDWIDERERFSLGGYKEGLAIGYKGSRRIVYASFMHCQRG
ncbi:hypothetical protein Tco_1297938 [Tanacetum coccineum]